MKVVFKHAFNEGFLPEAGDSFETWWKEVGSKLKPAQRDELLLTIANRGVGK